MPSYWTLGFKSYDAYLRSAHWRRLKRQYRQDDRPQDCYCCGERENVHLHHRTYERLGAELLDDLVPLCGRCHNLVHALERRGDISLDLAGLIDEARAERYRAVRTDRPTKEALVEDDLSRRYRAHCERVARKRGKKAA